MQMEQLQKDMIAAMKARDKARKDSLSALLSALKTDIDSGSEKESAGTEEIIVFSPGATSFGMFRNEFDRGNTFMAEVKKTFI